jgi:hypothetical protein
VIKKWIPASKHGCNDLLLCLVEEVMIERQPIRPESVQRALTLLYITLVIGLIRAILEASKLTRGVPIGIVIFMLFTFVILCIMWFLIRLIGKGRNWARISFFVLLITGLPFTIQPLQQALATNFFSGLLGIGQLILQFIAVAFLFQKATSDWFKQMEKIEPGRSS